MPVLEYGSEEQKRRFLMPVAKGVRVCQIYEGSSDIQRLVIAREVAR
jgi:alkylation response protein AidB-like acyl-CoA dehydrogenase